MIFSRVISLPYRIKDSVWAVKSKDILQELSFAQKMTQNTNAGSDLGLSNIDYSKECSSCIIGYDEVCQNEKNIGFIFVSTNQPSYIQSKYYFYKFESIVIMEEWCTEEYLTECLRQNIMQYIGYYVTIEDTKLDRFIWFENNGKMFFQIIRFNDIDNVNKTANYFAKSLLNIDN